MKVSELKRDPGLHPRKRVGRGESSGRGKTSGRGHKGQRARSSGTLPVFFEGGQMPLIRRLPKKKGFRPPRSFSFQIVNLFAIEQKFSPSQPLGPQEFQQAGLIRSTALPVKILGQGSLQRAFHLRAHAFSQSAVEKIHAAGGKVEVLPWRK